MIQKEFQLLKGIFSVSCLSRISFFSVLLRCFVTNTNQCLYGSIDCCTVGSGEEEGVYLNLINTPPSPVATTATFILPISTWSMQRSSDSPAHSRSDLLLTCNPVLNA